MTAPADRFVPGDAQPVEVMPGMRARFVHTDHLTVAHWTIEAGAEVPLHEHPHEQVVNLLQGSFEMRVADEVYVMAPGDTVVVPGGVPHAARARTDVRCLDVFLPVREEYRL
ncbi:MAG TPA: cupin domain-containing protein [Kineosporiaceae bacterium]